MNKTTGNSLSINDITDLFIKKINDILAMPINNQEKIKLLNIQYLQIKETILPPDYDKKPII
jgi:predicted RNA-binding protein with RPS1 domain